MSSGDSVSQPFDGPSRAGETGSGTSPPDSPSIARADEQTVISKRRPTTTAAQQITFRPSEVGAALEGERLGHFLLEEFVGGGGMGAVFRGLDTMLGRIVAVKVVSSERNDAETLRRFRNEAQSAARLDHPHIARVYYVGEDKGWNYIVFEYIEGVNVRDLVEQKGRLSQQETIRHSLQLAEALAHAAARDVVHRDIKPSNILITPDGRAKLVDMGLARLHHVDAPAHDLTATGVTLGTFDYISPEQARDPRSADARSDLYSLGCTLYYMLTGMPPFPEGTVLQKLLSHSSEPPPDPRELCPELGDDVAAVVLKLMAKLPGQRYQSAGELMADLTVLAERRGLSVVAQAAAPAALPADSWQARFLWQLPWLVPCVLLCAAAAAMHFAWDRRDTGQANLGRPELLLPGDAVGGSFGDLASEGGGARSAPALRPDVEDPGAAAGRASGQEREGSDRTPTAGVEPGTANTAGSTAENAATLPPPRFASSTAESSRPASGDAEGPTLIPRQSLVVAEEPFAASADEEVVSTLAAALQRASENPAIDTIELRVARLESAAVTIDLRRSLTIKAGAGYRPLLVFRPEVDQFLPERRMIRLIGGHDIAFEEIDFRLELPYEPGLPCTLFSLNQVNGVVLSRCTLTIHNPAVIPTTAFFWVQAPRSSGTLNDQDELADVTPPSIELEQCSVRGQATLVRAVEGLPFWLTWNQGLFASTERMIDVGGLLDRLRADVVRVDLSRVTASMAQGLARVGVDTTAPKLPALIIRCYDCVMTHSPESPLVQHAGVASLKDAADRFRYVGDQNFYEYTDVRWRVRTVDRAVHDFLWEDRDHVWYEERFADRVVRWADPSADRPPSVARQTAADFRLDARQRQLAGFDEAQIAAFPAAEDD